MTETQFRNLHTWIEWRAPILEQFEDYIAGAKSRATGLNCSTEFNSIGHSMVPFAAACVIANPADGPVAQMDAEDMVNVTVNINFMGEGRVRVDSCVAKSSTSWDMPSIEFSINASDQEIVTELHTALRKIIRFLRSQRAQALAAFF